MYTYAVNQSGNSNSSNVIEQPSSETSTELSTLHEATQALVDSEKSLEERLSIVLRPDSSGKTVEVNPEASLTPLANSIRDARYSVEITLAIISSIRNRIEL